ncbi:hypothetical protein DH2020_050023 [Rehmannia glutinosa]|uniref:Protein kinase domain-containing protein n=1 Tax=Rehmannia glutinosa TaxID=99300 RepID=A0ABR0U156_REHGL
MAVKSCGVSHSSSLENEKLILDELRDCPEIIRCFGESFSYENGEKLYNVLLEYASGGSLADKLKNSDDRRLPEFEVRKYTKALLRGLHYIHKFGNVHCDIKLQNILLCSDGGVKIADFGLARRAAKNGAVSGCELRGTPMYMSPEMVTGGEQGAPADIWALGCVVSEMVSGSPAWKFSDVAALLMRIGVGEEVPEIPGTLSDEGKDFLLKCFVKDPTKRWTAEMLLNHPFIHDDQDFNGDDDDSVFALKDREENPASTSPRCPFDFPDWVSLATCSITSLPSPGYFPETDLWFSEEPNYEVGSISPAARLLTLVFEQGPDWSVSDDWVTVR